MISPTYDRGETKKHNPNVENGIDMNKKKKWHVGRSDHDKRLNEFKGDETFTC